MRIGIAGTTFGGVFSRSYAATAKRCSPAYANWRQTTFHLPSTSGLPIPGLSAFGQRSAASGDLLEQDAISERLWSNQG